MWSYYGSKSKIVHLYPKPKYNKIIEPFAGSARYSLLYWDHDIVLVDKYEVIVRIWKWLQQCSPGDILSLPKLKLGDRINRETFDCDEQFWFMGYMVNEAVSTPKVKMSWMAIKNYEADKVNISRNIYKCRKWNIVHGDYHCLGNIEATWYIDPPYQHGGHSYKFSNKLLEFTSLAEWCKERKGQVIVCENTKADWLPFQQMKINQGARNTRTIEAIWSNLPTDYDTEQFTLLDVKDFQYAKKNKKS